MNTGYISNILSVLLVSTKIFTMEPAPEIPSLFPGLKRLHLIDNQKPLQGSDFVELTTLTELYMNYQKLQEVPHGVFTLINLTLLDLSDNIILKLSKRVGQLTNLTSLTIASNALSKLPCLTSLINLEYFNCMRNRVGSLSLQGLSALKFLVASHNRLSILTEDEFVGCTRLQSLDVSHNALRCISSNILILLKFFHPAN